MVGWLATVASLTGALFFLASPVAAQPVTGHASNDDFLGFVSVGSIAEGRIGDRGETSDFELSVGETFPIKTGQFDWVHGETYDFEFIYEPGAFGGDIRFSFEGIDLDTYNVTALNSFFVRTTAELPDTSIVVDNFMLGPPPSMGSGGLTIYESAVVPLTPASSAADGNGANLDVLKISNVNLLDGFTFHGQVTVLLDGADPQPTGSQLGFQVYAVQAPDFPDADGDGVEDQFDNCVNDANFGQDNNDSDEYGDACDNCPFVANGSNETNDLGIGNQLDGDNDEAGDACDNCNPGCNLVIPDTGTCANKDQNDFDNDGVGYRCDNGPCANPNQEDVNGDGFGDICVPSAVKGAVLPAGGGGGSQGAGGGAQGTPVTVINISLDCNLDVGAANIGVLPTGGASFVDFGGCTDPHVLLPGEPDDNRFDCTSSLELGATVDPSGSYTIGPGITAETNSEANADIVFLQLTGQGGASNDLLCENGDQDVFLGALQMENFVEGDNPLSTHALGGFNPPRELLEGPSGSPEIDLAFIEVEILGSGDPLVTFELRRAPNDPDRRFELRMAAPDDEIDRLVVGLTANAAPTQGDVNMSGCEVPGNAVGNVPSDLLASLRGCPDPAVFPRSGVIGPTVQIPTAFNAFGVDTATYSVGPGPASGALRANTLYVAVESKTGTLNTSGGEDTILLAVVEYAEPVDTPNLFLGGGGETLPGFGPGVIITTSGATIPNQNSSIITTFSSDEDLDGDGFGDEDDNCPLTWNGGANPQKDEGGVDTSVTGDGIGNVCQCFDFSGDGVVDNADTVVSDEDDVMPCQEVLAGLPAEGIAAEKCATVNGTGIGIVDVVVGELESSGEDTGLADTNVGISAKAGGIQVCLPAVELAQ